MDVFVLACDPAAMIFDSRDYMAPLITPYEALVAFTGTYLPPKHYQYHLPSQIPSSSSTSTDLIPRSDMTLTTHAPPSAADFFQTQRQFRGLEITPDLPISSIHAGRSGIASNYADEPKCP